MYKLLIVEDEPLARHVIKALVLENFDDIQIVAEAESGREAIELCKKYEPDIILMDIRIPGINGIDASRQILGEFPITKILILTAYDDFNYIQQALNMGVKGYLLKPLQDEVVVHKIKEVIEQIRSTNESADVNKKIENSINIVKPFIEKELVTAFISGHVDIAEIKSYINLIAEEIEAGYFMLISYDSNNVNHISDAVRNKIIRDKVNEVVMKFLPTMKKCFLGQTIGNIIVTFFPISFNSNLKEIEKESVNLAKEIKRKINVIAGVDVSIGIGSVYSEIQNLRLSYNEASEALRKAVLSYDVVLYQSIKNEHALSGNYEYPVKLESEMLECIKSGKTNKAKEAADNIIEQVFRNCNDQLIIKDYIGQLISITKRTLQQMGVNKSALNIIGILMDTGTIHDISELQAWSKSNIFALIHQADELKQHKDYSVVERVLSYINSNFNKDITLDILSEEVGLSPQYISRLFKEELGENFVDYFTKKRINFAKELLIPGGKNIGEVSLIVGFGDVNYFCRVFKKVTGLTPKQYKLNNSK